MIEKIIKEIDLEKFLRTFQKQLGLISINFTINCLKDMLNISIENVKSIEDGIKVLLETAKNHNFKLFILFTIFLRLEIFTAAETWLITRELKDRNGDRYNEFEQKESQLRDNFLGEF